MDDLKADRLIAEIDVDGNPDWQVTADGALWVATGQSIVRINETSNAVVAAVDVRSPCLSLTAGFGSVWSPSCATHQVYRIDPATNAVVASIPVGGVAGDGEGQLVAAFGSVWLFTDDHGTLVRIDPKTNQVAATYTLGGNPVALVAAGDSLWATVPGSNAVLQIDQRGKVVRTIDVVTQPRFEAADKDAVWVLGQDQGDVSRIDPVSATVVATIPVEVPGSGGCVATGGGSVWITMPSTPFSRIDPKTNKVVEQFTGPGGDCISYGAGSVWLSNNDQGTVWRIRP